MNPTNERCGAEPDGAGLSQAIHHGPTKAERRTTEKIPTYTKK